MFCIDLPGYLSGIHDRERICRDIPDYHTGNIKKPFANEVSIDLKIWPNDGLQSAVSVGRLHFQRQFLPSWVGLVSC